MSDNNILIFPGVAFLEVIFRLGQGVATTLVVPRETIEGAILGTKIRVKIEEGEFDAEIMAIRPLRER